MSSLTLHYGQDRLLNDTQHKFNLAIAGVRYGKTCFGAKWHFRRACANSESRESLVVAPDNKLLREKCLDEYVQLLEALDLKENHSRGFKVNLSVPHLEFRFHKARHKVIFLTGEKPRKIVAYTASHAWADEIAICDEQVHKNLVKRVSCPKAKHKLQLLYTTTPEGTNWLYEKFASDDLEQVEGEPFKKSRSALILEGSSFDNPYLTQDYLDSIVDEFAWDTAYYENYILGKFTSLSRDRFYFSFNERTHLGDYPLQHDINSMFLCWDANVGQMTWTVVQDIAKDYYVCDENGSNGRNIDDACEQFINRYPPAKYGGWRITVLGDASLHARSTHSYLTGYQIIEENLKKHYPLLRVAAPRGNPFVEERSRCTNRLLAQGKLHISKNCKKVIQSLKLSESDGKGGIKKPSDDRHTHAMESVDMGLIVLEPPKIERRIRGVNL